jgi:hypothetical protein
MREDSVRPLRSLGYLGIKCLTHLLVLSGRRLGTVVLLLEDTTPGCSQQIVAQAPRTTENLLALHIGDDLLVQDTT